MKVTTMAMRPRMTERRRWASIRLSPSIGVEGHEDEVDELDEDEGHDDPAHPVDKDVAAQDGRGRGGPELDPAQGQGDEGHDDQRVEDDGRQDGALGAVQLHDVESVQG